MYAHTALLHLLHACSDQLENETFKDGALDQRPPCKGTEDGVRLLRRFSKRRPVSRALLPLTPTCLRFIY